MNNELQLISRRLTGLTMKRPGLALGLWGEPGIGKTHTALALLRGTPCQTRSVHANQAFDKVIAQIPKPKKPTLWLEKILERISKNETLETGMLNQALVALLAANAPIVLQVEDLHEASIERLEFWQQLALGVVRTRGVGLLVTSRIQPPENFEAIRLSVLTREESNALLEAEIAAKLPPEALAWLFERAAGNPLFTLEFFRLLARQGSLWNDGQRWRFRTPERETMPVTVEALIEQVLHETISTPALENAIGAKAMLGLGASESLWAEVANLTLEDLSTVKKELEQQGVLVGGEFVHPLFREVVVNTLKIEQRQKFARQALEVLKDDPRVAAEFVKDANLEDQLALEWFEQAAQAASDVEDKIQAARFKAKAVEYALGEEKGRLAFEAAQELRLFDLSESAQMADIALSFQPKNEEAIFLRAELLAIQGSVIDSQEMLKRLSNIKQVEEKWLILQLKLCFAQNDHVKMLKICQEHPELLENTDPSLCWNISFLLSASGDNTRALIIAERGLAQPELTSDQRGSLLMPCGIILSNRGDYLGAEKLFTQAISLFQQSGRLRSLSAAYFNRAFVNELLSNYRAMTADLMEVIKLYNDLGDVIHVAYAKAMFGGALIPFAEFDRAEELLLESRTMLERMGVSPYLIMCETQLSILYLNWRSAHSEVLASKYALSALEHTRSLGDPLCILESLFCAAEVSISNGDGFQGFKLVEEMFKLLETIDVAKDRGNAYLVRAKGLEVFGRRDEALDAFHRAVELINVPLSIQTALLEIDRLTNNIDGARVRMKWFEERGLMNGVNIACRYFPELKTESYQTPTTSSSEPIPYLEVLGSMQIKLESQTTPVRGRKRQELLALLLEARVSGRSEVSKLELVDKLYPNADEIQANASLHNLMFNLRSSLGEGAISTTTNGYALGNLGSDIEDFLKNADTKLWRGTYLEGLTLETSDTVRESVYLALRTRAEVLLETDPLEVTRVGRLLCEADPYDLEALRLTVTGLRTVQNHRSLSRFYDQARTRFLEIGEVLPETWQDFLLPVMSA